MDVEGTVRFAAARAVVWEALLDPTALRGAIPGCDVLEDAGRGRFALVVHVGIAAVRGTYRGTATLSDVRAPDSYRLVARGEGEAGAIAGEGYVELTEAAGVTEVKYTVRLTASGGLARLGSRPLEGSARLLLSQFFKAMNSEVARRVP